MAIVIINSSNHTANASAATCKMLGSRLPIVMSKGMIHQAKKASGILAITDIGKARLYFFKFNEFIILLFKGV